MPIEEIPAEQLINYPNGTEEVSKFLDSK